MGKLLTSCEENQISKALHFEANTWQVEVEFVFPLLYKKNVGKNPIVINYFYQGIHGIIQSASNPLSKHKRSDDTPKLC